MLIRSTIGTVKYLMLAFGATAILGEAFSMRADTRLLAVVLIESTIQPHLAILQF